MEDKRFPALRRAVFENEKETNFLKKCVCVLQTQVDEQKKLIVDLQEQLTTLQSALSSSTDTEDNSATSQEVSLNAS